MSSILEAKPGSPEAQRPKSLFTISRVPIAVSIVLGLLKWLGVAWFRSLAWEWALFPWWFSLCMVSLANHRVLFGRTFLTRGAWAATAVTAILLIFRALQPSTWGGVGWWAVTAPFWGLAAICWLQSLTVRYAEHEIGPAGRLYLVLAVVVLAKWFGLAFFADWSWFWMGAVCALSWSLLCVYNVLCLEGARYLPLAVTIFLVTCSLAVRQSLRGIQFDLNWVLALLPAIVFGAFCRLVVLHRIRELRILVRRRNEYITDCLAKGVDARPVSLERETVAAPLPGGDPCFRLLPLGGLLVIAIPMDLVLGRVVGWAMLRATYWAWKFHSLAGFAVFHIIGAFGYFWGYLVGGFLVALVAKRWNCGHRPTLWIVTLAASTSALIGLGWSLVGLTGISTVSELTPLPVSVILFTLFLVYLLVVGQAGPFGLIKVFTPVEWEPTGPETGAQQEETS